jgi:hypothetical protein
MRKKELFRKFPLKSETSVASHQESFENLYIKGPPQPKQKRVFAAALQDSTVLKKNIRGSREALNEAEMRVKAGRPVTSGHKVQIAGNLAPLSPSHFYESSARAASRLLNTVEVVALPGQPRHIDKIGPSPEARKIRKNSQKVA